MRVLLGSASLRIANTYGINTITHVLFSYYRQRYLVKSIITSTKSTTRLTAEAVG